MSRRSSISWILIFVILVSVVAATLVFFLRETTELNYIWQKNVATLTFKPNKSKTSKLATLDASERNSLGSDVTKAKTKPDMFTCELTSACAELKSFFQENWDETKPKAAVYILSRGSDAGTLKKTLLNLQSNFLSKYNYPVIIFHEKDFIPHIKEMQSLTKLNIFFQEVEFEVPQYIFPNAAKVFQCRRFNLGYRHMCRFHSKTIYELPIMLQLEYYLRLDAHSYITKPVPYDLFKNMKEKGLLYLYPCVSQDASACVSYLWDAVKIFISVKRIKPYFFDKMAGNKMFYNNFEMARMDVFTATSYQNYINYIDQLGGTYHNRWGDAPIKSLAVSLFVPRNKTQRIADVSYTHRKQVINKERC